MGLNMVDDEKPRISPGKAQFLAAFEVSANVAQACRVVGWSRANAYKHRANDPEFAKLWLAAEDVAVDALALEARRRAFEGTVEDVYHQGQVVGQKVNHHDTLLMFLMKAHRPELYRDNFSIEHTGKGGKPIEVAHTVDVAALLADPVARKALEQLSEAAGYDGNSDT